MKFILISILAAGAILAAVPPDVAKELVNIGRGVCVPETAKIYGPLQPKAPYAGVTVVRDISYAPDPRTIMDVFAPEKGGGNRPVLIYVSGGGGDKRFCSPRAFTIRRRCRGLQRPSRTNARFPLRLCRRV